MPEQVLLVTQEVQVVDLLVMVAVVVVMVAAVVMAAAVVAGKALARQAPRTGGNESPDTSGLFFGCTITMVLR